LKRILVIGFILGIIGALLDFYSGYSFFVTSEVTMSSMGVTTVQYNNSSIAWGGIFVVLGVTLICTAVVNISSRGMGRMSLFGGLMIIYGLAMLALSFLMYSGITPIMQQNSLVVSSVGMFIVGALMCANGWLMRRNRMQTPPHAMKDAEMQHK
jgi:hypothetical protein